MSRDDLRRLNQAPPEQAGVVLRDCCGSSRWVAGMLARRPFADRASLLEAADEVWREMETADWLEALSAHPRIGERAAAHGQSRIAADWSAEEQAGTAGAAAEVRQRLAAGNAAYEARFGRTFIICATGKDAEEMLEALETRLGNSPDVELRIASGEQAKITRLRLLKAIEAL
jgi:2-oxo-4-hydroxy-4-carboxy-5-ureidoimidazoline decarboxylase